MTTQIAREKTYIGNSFQLAARVLLYAPSHREDNTYHNICYTSRGALAGTIDRLIPPGGPIKLFLVPAGAPQLLYVLSCAIHELAAAGFLS